MRFYVGELNPINNYAVRNEYSVILVSVLALSHDVGCLELLTVVTKAFFFYIELPIFRPILVPAELLSCPLGTVLKHPGEASCSAVT